MSSVCFHVQPDKCRLQASVCVYKEELVDLIFAIGSREEKSNQQRQRKIENVDTSIDGLQGGFVLEMPGGRCMKERFDCAVRTAQPP